MQNKLFKDFFYDMWIKLSFSTFFYHIRINFFYGGSEVAPNYFSQELQIIFMFFEG